MDDNNHNPILVWEPNLSGLILALISLRILAKAIANRSTSFCCTPPNVSAPRHTWLSITCGRVGRTTIGRGLTNVCTGEDNKVLQTSSMVDPSLSDNTIVVVCTGNPTIVGLSTTIVANSAISRFYLGKTQFAALVTRTLSC